MLSGPRGIAGGGGGYPVSLMSSDKEVGERLLSWSRGREIHLFDSVMCSWSIGDLDTEGDN